MVWISGTFFQNTVYLKSEHKKVCISDIYSTASVWNPESVEIQMDNSPDFKQLLASENRMGPVVRNLDAFQCSKALCKVDFRPDFGHLVNRMQTSCLD